MSESADQTMYICEGCYIYLLQLITSIKADKKRLDELSSLFVKQLPFGSLVGN